MKKTERLDVRLTPDEKEYVKEMAQSCNMSITDFFLHTLYDGKVIHIDMQPVKELANEINKIGVNINQIAKHVNESRTVSNMDFERLQKEFQKLSVEVYKHLYKTNVENGDY